MALTIDGSAAAGPGKGTPNQATCSLTTTLSSDIILVQTIVNNDTDGGGPTSAHLTFTQRAVINDVAHSGIFFASYWAIASSPLTAEAISITAGLSASTCSVTAFAVNGGNTSSPFDSNGSLPATALSATPPTFSTSNANDMLITSGRSDGTSATGWTFIISDGIGGTVDWYKLVSTTQSGVSGATNGANTAFICDALVAAGAAPTVPLGMQQMFLY